MPSVSADIFHFSKAVFHPTTALCTPILTKPIRSFQMAFGNIRVTVLQLSGVSRLSIRCAFNPNTRPRIIGFPFTGSRWCLLCLGVSHHIKISCRSRNGDPLRTLDQALSRTVGTVPRFPCPGLVWAINCCSLLSISLSIASQSPDILKRSTFYLRNFKSASFCWLLYGVGIHILFHLATVRITLLRSRISPI